MQKSRKQFRVQVSRILSLTKVNNSSFEKQLVKHRSVRLVLHLSGIKYVSTLALSRLILCQKSTTCKIIMQPEMQVLSFHLQLYLSNDVKFATLLRLSDYFISLLLGSLMPFAIARNCEQIENIAKNFISIFFFFSSFCEAWVF